MAPTAILDALLAQPSSSTAPTS